MFSRSHLVSLLTKRFIQRSLKPPKERPSDVLWKVIENKKLKSSQDWKHIRDEILNINGPITLANIDAMTVGTCTLKKKYDLALSYLDFLKEQNIELNLATIGKYFKLLYARGMEETFCQEDEDRILAMYDSVQRSYPVLDSLSLDNIIQALSLTKKWRLCLELLEEVKVTASPSSHCYSAIVAAAFLNNSEEVAWTLLEEMIESDKQLQDVVYATYCKKVATSSNKTNELEKMFNFMQKNCVKLESSCVESFVQSLKQLQIVLHSSSILPRGVCKSCNKNLNVFDLTESEFSDLKSKIIQNVIIGKNVYNKTTSEELKRFKDFVTNMENYDIIVDGLNVAYSTGVDQPPHVTSGLVASMVSHFVSKNKKVLVLGRKHMNKWPKQNWNYILQNASVFLTEDLSHDDPYLLYCALNSGKDTIIITRDLMRSHKFLLKEVHLKLLFDRWLAQRQYILIRVQGRIPIFKKPLPFSHIAQKIDGYWHIPCAAINTNSNWLCIKI